MAGKFNFIIETVQAIDGNANGSGNDTASGVGDASAKPTKVCTEAKTCNTVADIVQYKDTVKMISCSGITKDEFEALAICQNVKSLKLDAPDPSITTLAAVSNFKKLEMLNISNSNVSDITALDHCRELRKISITNSQVTDLAPIVNLTKAEDINFQGNNIADDTALISLAQNQYTDNLVRSSKVLKKIINDTMKLTMKLGEFKSMVEKIEAGEAEKPKSAEELAKLVECSTLETPLYGKYGLDLTDVRKFEWCMTDFDANIRKFAVMLKQKAIMEQVSNAISNIMFDTGSNTIAHIIVSRSEDPCAEFLKTRAERLALLHGIVSRDEVKRRPEHNYDGDCIVDTIPERFYSEDIPAILPENMATYVKKHGMGAIKEIETRWNHPEAVRLAKANKANELKSYFASNIKSLSDIAIEIDPEYARSVAMVYRSKYMGGDGSQNRSNVQSDLQNQIKEIPCRFITDIKTSIEKYYSTAETFDDEQYIRSYAAEQVAIVCKKYGIKDVEIVQTITNSYIYPLKVARIAEKYYDGPTYENFGEYITESYVLEEILKEYYELEAKSAESEKMYEKMHFVRKLNVSNNQLAKSTSGRFHNLSSYNISGNKLVSEDFKCDGMATLTEFDCSRNNLRHLESSLTNINNMQTWGGLLKVHTQFRQMVFVNVMYQLSMKFALTGNLFSDAKAISVPAE